MINKNKTNHSTIQLFNSSTYQNKKVLVTGHTGFKGSWLTLWLNLLGADVVGYSLPPNTEPALSNVLDLRTKCTSIFGDIRDKEQLGKVFLDHKPDMVFHLAAQPLVRLSYADPVNTYETNVIGTLNVLEAARLCPSVKAFVNVTTDKCYENKEVARGYREDEPMGGHDMYSSSKGCVEIMSASYRRSFLQDGKHYAMATARAGNVIGGGDWAMDRLIPDCIRSIEGGLKPQGVNPLTLQPFNPSTIIIRNPIAVRPWQHVLEPLSGYLLLGQKLLKSGEKYSEGFNFGPNPESILTVAEVVKKVVENYGKGEVVVHKADNLHEAGLLMLNIEKARDILGWSPVYTADEAIKATVEWYKKFYNDENMLEFTIGQIQAYQEKMSLVDAASYTKI